MNSSLQSFLIIIILISFFSCKESLDPNSSEVYTECCGTYQSEWEWTHGGDTAYIYFPNAFTPNGDGINDIFLPISNENVNFIESMKIQTNDDKKTLLYYVENTDPDFSSKGWNGKDLNGNLFRGSFVYLISYNVLNDQNKGSISIGCSILCEPDSKELKNNFGCFYPNQVDNTGKLLNPWPNGIDPCFN